MRSGLESIEKERPDIYHTITAAGESHGSDMQAYLIYMYPRLFQIHRILKSTGSFYLHVDPTASHYLKIMLDAIFGEKNFRNEIVWAYYRARPGGNQFARLHDTIFYYSKGRKGWIFNKHEAQVPLSKEALRTKRIVRKDGSVWTRKRNTKDMGDWWTDINLPTNSKERTGFKTQKPLKLLERIIKASTNEGDIVLDPFCGCATACVAAAMWDRRYIGIDIGSKAQELIVHRLRTTQGIMDIDGRMPVLTDVIPVINAEEPPPNKWRDGLKEDKYGEQKGECANDRCQLRGFKFPLDYFEIDHITPKSKGGTYHDDNARLLCGPCNRIRGNRSDDYMKMITDERFNNMQVV